MRANVGDRLVSAAGSSSVGLIVGVLGDDDQPPYIVRWLRTGHIAMVTPGPYARILPASHPARAGFPRPQDPGEISESPGGDDQPGA